MIDESPFDDSAERLARVAREWWNIMHQAPSAAQRQEFARWRDANPLHGKAYDRQQYLWEQGRLLAETSFGRNRRLRRGSIFDRRPAVAWTSAVAAAAVLALVSVNGSRRLIEPPAAEQVATSFASPAGQLRMLHLPDGSQVTLDAASRLLVAFATAERRVWLVAGRARFAVAYDTVRPFVVQAADAEVIARGTVFDVDLADRRARVLLLRGSVEVRRRNGTVPASRFLKAGQEIVVERTGALAAPQQARGIDAQWPSPMLALEATPLAEVIAELNRHNAVKIVLADPGLGAQRVSGAFRKDDPAGFAAAAAMIFKLKLRRDKDILTLVASPASSIK